ncbi:hypothetical protein DFH09DRAFT_374634 [Mycena vulgaris]|nr:hypothetical protein DFH09DRAFT_374634 [Mycena vulgaris]
MRGNRRHIPKEKKDLIVVMANHRTPQELADITYISDRTIRRILRNWRRTGSTVKVPIQSGRPRVLTALDVNFLEGLVRRTPDIYTWELRRALFLQRCRRAQFETLLFGVDGPGKRYPVLHSKRRRTSGWDIKLKSVNIRRAAWFSSTRLPATGTLPSG